MCQAYSIVPKCDGQLVVQGNSDPINRKITVSSCFQADLSNVVHSSYKLICHSSEPQTSSIHIPNSRAWKIDALDIDWSALTCLPSCSSVSQDNPENMSMQLLHNTNSPRLARDALVLGPTAALNRDPSPTVSVNNISHAVTSQV